MNSVLDSSEEKTNGTKLLRLAIDGGTTVLRNYLMRSIIPSTLQDVLLNHMGRLYHLKSSKKIITSDQWNQLFPSTSVPPNPQTFDITLLHLLLREVCGLTAPADGWHKMPSETDLSVEANIVRIKNFRNELCHGISTSIPNDKFQDKLHMISQSLVALGLDQKEVDRLATEPIDHDTERRVNEEVEKWKIEIGPRVNKLENDYQMIKGDISAIQASISGQATSNLSNCLPDKNNVVGRSQELEEITDAIRTESAAAVLVTGGPGFGKTAVAIEVGHELVSKGNEERTVLFCSLRSKAAIAEVATSMILPCSANLSQPPEHPQHWLRNWSKQQQKKVSFILDNADDVLESGDRTAFVTILKDMRTLSNCKITFVITTRKLFQLDPNLRMKCVRLRTLSREHAQELLLSKVLNPDVKQGLSKTDKLVQLCGCVPLALCIIGSLLLDYPEDQLIERLEEKPLDVLKEDESDENSVEKAIYTSFNFLREHEQKALILLSVFPGSFSNIAAQAVIKAVDCQGDPGSILRSLKNRSLIETPAPYRYQIHQFIQTFAKKIDEANLSPVLQLQGEKAACIHFISHLVDIATCYWSKDKCQEAIHSFNTDRHNFEYFFQFFIKGQEKQDSQLKKTMENLVEKISQTCTFLEMCILPSDYLRHLIELDQLLMSYQQPVTKRVELLCLLGHEYRKIGNQDKYKKLIEMAADLHSEHSEEFDNEKVSEAFFCNNYARFLSDVKNCSKAEEQFIKSLEVCEQYKPMDFVQKGISLLYAGRNDNRQNKRHQAEAKFNVSLKIFQENLGCHVTTALLLKEIADFHLFHGEKSLGSATDQCKSIKLYKQALEMMESVGIKEQKECILLLANLGVCYQLQGEMEGAKNSFQASLRIAEQELTENHRWKIYAMTQMAFWCKKNGNSEKAEEWKQKALTMRDTLRLPDHQPPNKFLLDKI